MPSSAYSLLDELKRYGEVSEPSKDLIVVRLTSSKVKEAAKRLQWSLGARYATSVGVDARPLDGTFKVLHVFGADKEKKYVVLEVSLSPAAPALPSITPVIPGADWAEREAKELLGIELVGNPNSSEELVLPPWCSERPYPLRKEFPYNKKLAPPTPPKPPETSEARSRRVVVPVGPYHPALHEPEYFELHVEGERIVDAKYVGFMVHRGIEKLAEEKLTVNQVPFIAERICGICGFTHSTAYCQAVENAVKADVPERARFIRSIMLEIERLHSHLLWFGVFFHVLGFDTGFMVMWRIREKVMDLAEAITGNRKTYGLNLVGGVRRDITDEHRRRALKLVRELREEFPKYAGKFLGLSEVKTRSRDVGVLGRDDAKKMSVVGPVARASGMDIDTRRDHPYAAYDEVDFNVPVRDEGDALARALVRYEEFLESLNILEQLLENMPSTPIMADNVTLEPRRMGLGVTEAPRGENVHFVITGAHNMIYRWRVRAASYNNIPALRLMLRGESLADAPAIIASIDPCFSCTDRVVVVDVRSGTRRSCRLEELPAVMKVM